MHSCSGFRHSIARCLLERLKSAQTQDQLGIVDQMLETNVLEVCAKQTRLTLSHVVEELERECIDNQVRDQVREALDFISTTPRDIAHAYDLVLAVTNKRMNMHFKICKLASRVVRDLLILSLICQKGRLTDAGFRSSLEKCFRRKLDNELASQMHKSRACVARLGLDRSSFNKQAKDMFPGLSEENNDAVFRVYKAVADLHPEFLLPPRVRHKKIRNRTTDAAAAATTAYATETEDEACAAVATIAYAKEIEDEANDVSDVSKCVQSEAIAEMTAETRVGDDPSLPIFIQGTPGTGARTFATSLSAEEYELSV